MKPPPRPRLTLGEARPAVSGEATTQMPPEDQHPLETPFHAVLFATLRQYEGNPSGSSVSVPRAFFHARRRPSHTHTHRTHAALSLYRRDLCALKVGGLQCPSPICVFFVPINSSPALLSAEQLEVRTPKGTHLSPAPATWPLGWKAASGDLGRPGGQGGSWGWVAAPHQGS